MFESDHWKYVVFQFGFYWTAPGLGGPHPTYRGLCCCVSFCPHLWWLYVPKFLGEMVSWEDKVSQALCFGGLASHSPFLMWRLFKDFCLSYLNIGLPSLESCLSSHQEEVGPMGGESVDKIWEGHALLCFFPGGKHLFSASLGTCSLLHYLGLWDCHSYSQRAICRLELDFGLGWKRWWLAPELLSPILTASALFILPSPVTAAGERAIAGGPQSIWSLVWHWHIYANTCALRRRKIKSGSPKIRQTQSKGLNKENHVLSGAKIGYRVHFQDFMTP